MICKHCGSALSDSATSCDYCGQPVESSTQTATPVTDNLNTTSTQSGSWQADALPQQVAPLPEPKEENMVTGIVGALIGAAIGAAVIILLGQMGYVASLSGLILAVCTLKGYELLGHRLSVKGAIICVILIVATPYFANRLDCAIFIQKEVKSYWGMSMTLGEAYDAVPELIDQASYIKSLVMIYLFAAIGAFSSLRDLFKK